LTAKTLVRVLDFILGSAEARDPGNLADADAGLLFRKTLRPDDRPRGMANDLMGKPAGSGALCCGEVRWVSPIPLLAF